MLGAIIGDIVGSVYEWTNIKTKDFPLFSEKYTRLLRVNEKAAVAAFFTRQLARYPATIRLMNGA